MTLNNISPPPLSLPFVPSPPLLSGKASKVASCIFVPSRLSPPFYSQGASSSSPPSLITPIPVRSCETRLLSAQSLLCRDKLLSMHSLSIQKQKISLPCFLRVLDTNLTHLLETLESNPQNKTLTNIFSSARIIGSTATAIVLEQIENPKDLDLCFAFDFSSNTIDKKMFFNQIRNCFFDSLQETFSNAVTRQEILASLKNQKLVFDPENQWSLFTLGNIDFRFNILTKREWDFTCRSFQINLPFHNQIPSAFCLAPSFEIAREDAIHKRLSTTHPKEIFRGLDRLFSKLENGFTCQSKELYQALVERYFKESNEASLETLLNHYFQTFVLAAPTPQEKDRRESIALEEFFNLMLATLPLHRTKEATNALFVKVLDYIQKPSSLSFLSKSPTLASFVLEKAQEIPIFWQKFPEITVSIIDSLPSPQKKESIDRFLLPTFFSSKERQPLIFPLCQEAIPQKYVKEWIERPLLDWEPTCLSSFYQTHLSELPKKKISQIIESFISIVENQKCSESFLIWFFSLPNRGSLSISEYQRLLLIYTNIIEHSTLEISKKTLFNLLLQDTSQDKTWKTSKVQALLHLKQEEISELFCHLLEKDLFAFTKESDKMECFEAIATKDLEFYGAKIPVFLNWYAKEQSKIAQLPALQIFRYKCMQVLFAKKDLLNIGLFCSKPPYVSTKENESDFFFQILPACVSQEEIPLFIVQNNLPKNPAQEKLWIDSFTKLWDSHEKSLFPVFMELEAKTPPFSSTLQTIRPFELYQFIHQKLLDANQEAKAQKFLCLGKERKVLSSIEIESFIPIWEAKRVQLSKPLSFMKRELEWFGPDLLKKIDPFPFMNQYLLLSYSGFPSKLLEELDRYIEKNSPIRRRLLLSICNELLKAKKINGKELLSLLTTLPQLSPVAENPGEMDLWLELFSYMEPKDTFLSLFHFWHKQIPLFSELERLFFRMQYGNLFILMLQFHSKTALLDIKQPEIEEIYPLLASENNEIASSMYIWALNRKKWPLALEMLKKIPELSISCQKEMLEKTIEYILNVKGLSEKETRILCSIVTQFYPFFLQNKEIVVPLLKKVEPWLEKSSTSLSLLTYILMSFAIYIQKTPKLPEESETRKKIVDCLFRSESQLNDIEIYLEPIFSKHTSPALMFSSKDPFHRLLNICICQDALLIDYPFILEEKSIDYELTTIFDQLRQAIKNEPFIVVYPAEEKIPSRFLMMGKERIYELAQTCKNAKELLNLWSCLLSSFDFLLTGFTKEDFSKSFYEPLFQKPNEDIIEVLPNWPLVFLLHKVELHLEEHERFALFEDLILRFQKLWISSKEEYVGILSAITVETFYNKFSFALGPFFVNLEPEIEQKKALLLKSLYCIAFRKCASLAQPPLDTLSILAKMYPGPVIDKKSNKQIPFFPNEKAKRQEIALMTETFNFLTSIVSKWQKDVNAGNLDPNFPDVFQSYLNFYIIFFENKHPLYLSSEHYFYDFELAGSLMKVLKVYFEKDPTNAIYLKGFKQFVTNISCIIGSIKQNKDILLDESQATPLLQTAVRLLFEMSKNPIYDPFLKDPVALESYTEAFGVKGKTIFECFLQVILSQFPKFSIS
ncbi:MAG: hypothetical protein WCP39_02555 [Chlamydiota bacterium]